MTAHALDGYTNATDLADALIAAGTTARQAHRLVGERVRLAESEGRRLDDSDLLALGGAIGLPALAAPLDAYDSGAAKRTTGSTQPASVAAEIDKTLEALDALQAEIRR